MIQIIYFSSASALYSKQDLLDILRIARSNNTRLGVTGILLYKDGSIMQVLEGEAEAVDPLFEVIQQDPRHKDVIVIDRAEIGQRGFADWSMGFRDLTDRDLSQLTGYSQYLNTPSVLRDLARDLSTEQGLLHLFAYGLMSTSRD
jgi:acylphosphatase